MQRNHHSLHPGPNESEISTVTDVTLHPVLKSLILHTTEHILGMAPGSFSEIAGLQLAVTARLILQRRGCYFWRECSEFSFLLTHNLYIIHFLLFFIVF